MTAYFRALVVVLAAIAILGASSAQQRRKSQRAKPALPAASKDQSRQGIEELHQKDIQASIAFDTDALAALWTDDIVALPPGIPPLVGREANVKYLEASKHEMAKYDILAYNQEWQEVFPVSDDYAWEWGYISGRLRPVAGGEEIEYRYKALRILKRQPDGSWKVHRTAWNDMSKPGIPQPKSDASPESTPERKPPMFP